MNRERALKAFQGEMTDRIPHWEIISCPDAIEYITGIDPWQHPRLAQKALVERYAVDLYTLPLEDNPIPRPPNGVVYEDAEGRKTVRWGWDHTWHWDWGHRFKSVEDVLNYQPLEHWDYREMDPIGMDLSPSEDELAKQFQQIVDRDRAANGDLCLEIGHFYNTMFMWPLLTFGWELWLEVAACYPQEAKRLLRDFSEISRKVFRAWAKTDVQVVSSHDDICHRQGPVFSPKWLRENIYPYYEEFWGYLKASGKKIFFVSDGNVDLVADDVLACGADGIFCETYTDWKAFARKHPDKVLLGGGDNRVIMSNDREAIEAMVREMAEVGRHMPGYFFCVGNHLTWDLPPEGVKAYFDAAEKYGVRRA